MKALSLFLICACVLSLAHSRYTSLECSSCEIILMEVESFLSTNSTVEDFFAELNNVCRDFPNGDLRQDCMHLAHSIAEALPSLPIVLNKDPYSPYAICAMVGICTIPCCVSKSSPEEIHLSITHDPSEMIITYVTSSEDLSQPFAYYGPAGTEPVYPVVGTTYTYTDGGWEGNIHKVAIKGLSPFSSYSYRVGSIAGGWSQVYNFTTRGANSSSEKGSVVFGVVGDMGTQLRSNKTIDAMIAATQSGSWSAVLHVGDISYADGYQKRWDEYMRKVEPLTSIVPYMTIPGNHEIAYDFASYRHRFNNPNPPEINGSMYYSFDWGRDVHVVAIDTESELDLPLIDDRQVEWIQADLLAVSQRNSRPWVIVIGHRPFYCSNENNRNCDLFAPELRARVEDVFFKYGVDLVINAHVHDYERTSPLWRGNVMPSGTAPVYMVNGAAGNREGLNSFGNGPWPAWSLVREVQYGYGVLTIHNATYMEWNWIENETKNVVDSYSWSRL